LEVLGHLGVVDRIIQESLVLSHVELLDVDRGRLLLSLSFGELRQQTRYPFVVVCPQSRIERIMWEALAGEPRAEVRFGAQVYELAEGDGGVNLHYREGDKSQSVTAAFAVGCDGAHSFVRKAIGARLKGSTFRMRAALADLTVAGGKELPFPRMTRRGGVATAIKIDHGLWRLIMPRAGDDAEALDSRVARATAFLFSGADAFPTWKSEYRLHRRDSSRLRRGRVLLAGDAAHLTSPVGGQGMNTGIQDAAALAPVLDTALREEGEAPLQRYMEQRRAAMGRSVIRVTNTLTRLLLARRGAALLPMLRLFDLLLRIGPIRRRALHRIAMLDDPSRPAGVCARSTGGASARQRGRWRLGELCGANTAAG
jgi:2-polyprenyl-6-methoxyphenol hydroxylase-like FAD-dependent oxidoreductase